MEVLTGEGNYDLSSRSLAQLDLKYIIVVKRDDKLLFRLPITNLLSLEEAQLLAQTLLNSK